MPTTAPAMKAAGTIQPKKSSVSMVPSRLKIKYYFMALLITDDDKRNKWKEQMPLIHKRDQSKGQKDHCPQHPATLPKKQCGSGIVLAEH